MTKLSTTLLKDLPIKQTSITDEDYVVVSSGGTKKLKVKDITKDVEKKAADLEVKTKELGSQLDTKANKTHIWNMNNMGQDIKEAMTGGSVAVVDKDAILEDNIVDNQVTPRKLSDTKMQMCNNVSDYTISSKTTSLYILPLALEAGKVDIVGKFQESIIQVYLLSKEGLKFRIKDKKEFIINTEGKICSLKCDFFANENDYIGVFGGIYYERVGGQGFYEVPNFIEGEAGDLLSSISDNTKLEYGLSLDVTYSNYAMYNHFASELNNVSSMIEPSSYSDIVKDFNIYTGISDITNFYIPNVPINNSGKVVVNLKSTDDIKFTLCILEKDGESFEVKYVKEVENPSVGRIELDYVTTGLGNEYIGFNGGMYFTPPNTSIQGTGMWEIKASDSYNIGDKIINLKDSISTGLDFAYFLGFTIDSKQELSSKMRKVQNDTSHIKTDIDYLKSNIKEDTLMKLTDFIMPRYMEIEEEVGFIGRWFEKNIEGTKCKCTINQGSEFYFKVKGATTINLIFKTNHNKETPYFAYSIDGGEFTRQLITNPTLPTVTTDEHIIRIVIDGLTETEDKWVGEKGISFERVTVDSGTIKGILPKNKKIMFFGDSITEGIRVIDMNANANGNSATGAFPFQTCIRLNSVSYRVGFGASGVTKRGSGGVPKCLTVIDNMTNSKESPYLEPDIIVLNHGTNDGGASDSIFQEEYNKVLDRLTVKYSGVPIFAVIPFGQRHAHNIRTCVANRSNCYLIETANWGVTYTDGVHPDINGGKIAGEKLSDEIVKVLGKSYFY